MVVRSRELMSYETVPVAIENQKILEDRLNISISNEFFENIGEETLDLAGQMFLFLNSCPRNFILTEILKSFKDYLFTENVESILKFLNQLIVKIKDDDVIKKTALAIINKFLNMKDLQYKNIEDIYKSTSPEKMKNKYKDLSYLRKGQKLYIGFLT